MVLFNSFIVAEESNSVSISLIWSKEVSKSPIQHSAVFGKDTIYVWDNEGKIAALNSKNGVVRWNWSKASNLMQRSYGRFQYRMTYDEKQDLLFVFPSNTIFALKGADGEEAWKCNIWERAKENINLTNFQFSIPSELWMNLLNADSMLIVHVEKVGIFAIESITGKLRWSIIGSFASPAIIGNRIAAVKEEKTMQLFNLSSGEKEGELGLEVEDSFFVNSKGNEITGLGNHGYYFVADCSEKQPKLKFQYNEKSWADCSPPSFSDTTFIFSSFSNPFVYAVNKDNGKTLWKFEDKAQFRYAQPIVANSFVYIMGDKKITILDINGKTVLSEHYKEWKKGETGELVPVSARNDLVVVTAGGNILVYKTINLE